jgi:hypothetical protein
MQCLKQEIETHNIVLFQALAIMPDFQSIEITAEVVGTPLDAKHR